MTEEPCVVDAKCITCGWSAYAEDQINARAAMQEAAEHGRACSSHKVHVQAMGLHYPGPNKLLGVVKLANKHE